MKNPTLLIVLSLLLLSLTSTLSAMPEPTVYSDLQLKTNILTFENDNNGDGQPNVFTTFTKINNTLIDIYVTQTSSDKKYKWQSAIFPINSNQPIQKEEYNPSTDVWTNTGNLNLYDYQWTTGWNLDGNTLGYSLFGSGSGDKRYRLIIPEGMDFKVFTGQGSEEVIYEWFNNTYYVYDTDEYSKLNFNVKIFINGTQIHTPDISFIEPATNTDNKIEFYPNLTGVSYPLDEVTFRVNTLSIPISKIETIQGTEELNWELSFNTFEAKNNITDKIITPNYKDLMTCIWDTNIIFVWQLRDCMSEIESYDITYYGEIIDLDPTISITNVTFYNSILENTTSEPEFSHLTINDSSLVGYWSMDVNARDLSNNNNDGTLTGNAFINSSSGVYGGALELDGTGDYVEIATDSSINVFTAITVCSWIKPSLVGNTFQRIVAKSNGANGAGGYALALNPSDKSFYLLLNGSLDTFVTTSISANNWYFICGTADGTKTRIYLNSSIIKENSLVTIPGSNANSLRVGSDAGIASREFNGSIDEVMIFNRALNETEVSEIYNSTYSRFYPEGNQTFKFQNVSLGSDNRINLTVKGEALNGSSLNATLWEANVGANSGYLPYNDSGYLELDGDGDYVSATTSNFNPNATTFSWWAYNKDNYLYNTYNTMIDSWYHLTDDRFSVWYYHQGFDYNLYYVTGDNATFIDTGYNAPANEWVFYTVKLNGTNIMFYADGVSIFNNTYTGLDEWQPYFAIGGQTTGSVNGAPWKYFNGSIDEVMIFNSSLSESEIQNIYNLNRTQSYNGSTDNLVSYYSFNTGSVQDDHGDNDGTSVGDAYIPNAQVSSEGLVGYWHGDGNALDYSGNGNDGTFAGNANANAEGVFNNSFSFDGTGDYVDLGIDTFQNILNGQEEFSVSLWQNMRPDRANNEGPIALAMGTDLNFFVFRIESINKMKVGVRSQSSDAFTYCVSDITFDIDTWYLLTATISFPENTIKFYSDGELICENTNVPFGSDVLAASNANYPDSIGKTASSSAYMDGLVDEVMIFNRSLSAEEIKSLYITGSTDHRNDGVGVNWTESETGELELNLTGRNDFIVNSNTNYLLPEFKFSTGEDYEFYSPVLENLTLESWAPIDNFAPNNPTPILESKDLLNSTMADLNCSSLLTDQDGDNITLTVRWYKNTVLNLTNTYTDVINGTTFMDNLSVRNLTIGDTWKCSMELSDGSLSSSEIDSNDLLIVKYNTSLEGVRFDLPSFPFDSASYSEDGSFQWNTSTVNESFILMTSFNIRNAVGGTGTVDVWGRVDLDGVTIHEEKLRSLSWLGGAINSGSTGFSPINYTIPDAGIHNVSFYFKQVSANPKPIEIYNNDISMGKLNTNASNRVDGSIQDFTNTSYTNSDLQSIYNFTVTRSYDSPDYHTFKVGVTANQSTTMFCRLRAIGDEEVSPYVVRYISSATSTGSISLNWIDLADEGNHTVSLDCGNTNGANVTFNGKIIEFALRDQGGYYISANQSSNESTNYTNTINLGTGNHTLTNHTLYFSDGGDSIFISASVSFKSASGTQTPYIWINSSLDSRSCYSEKDRTLSNNNDIGNVYMYFICKNSPTEGETHWVSLNVDVPTGETVTILDESLSSFEIHSFDTVTLNTPPNVVITNPAQEEDIFGNYSITWISNDLQLDSFWHNITLTNRTGTYLVTSYLADDVQSYLLDTTLYAEGFYNLTIIAFENASDELLVGNDTSLNIEIQQVPIITVQYPVNGTTYTTTPTTLNFTANHPADIQFCWYSLNGGATNSAPQAGANNFTGVSYSENSNTAIVYCNNSYGNIGQGNTTFIVDLPPVVINGVSGNQNLVFNYSQTCTDTQGVDSQWYSLKAVNYTYSSPIDISLSAGTYSITAWCNDTYGSVSFDTNSITTRDLDTNATTECPNGYYLDGDGTCKVDQTGGGSSIISSSSICRYKKLMYYNPNLAWMKQGGCI